MWLIIRLLNWSFEVYKGKLSSKIITYKSDVGKCSHTFYKRNSQHKLVQWHTLTFDYMTCGLVLSLLEIQVNLKFPSFNHTIRINIWTPTALIIIEYAKTLKSLYLESHKTYCFFITCDQFYWSCCPYQQLFEQNLLWLDWPMKWLFILSCNINITKNVHCVF